MSFQGKFQGKHKFTLPVELMSDPSSLDDPTPTLGHVVSTLRDWSQKLQQQQRLLEKAAVAGTTTINQTISGVLSGGGSGPGASADILVRAVIQAHPGGSALVTFGRKLPDVNYVPGADVYFLDSDGVTMTSVKAVISLITQFGFTVFCPMPGTLKATAVEIQ